MGEKRIFPKMMGDHLGCPRKGKLGNICRFLQEHTISLKPLHVTQRKNCTLSNLANAF